MPGDMGFLSLIHQIAAKHVVLDMHVALSRPERRHNLLGLQVCSRSRDCQDKLKPNDEPTLWHDALIR